MTATLGNGRGLRELALGVLGRDGGIERERSTRVPGSVPHAEEGKNRGDSVGGIEHAEWMYSLGINPLLGQVVDTWRVQRARLINTPSFSTLDCLGRLADVGMCLLKRCKGSVKLLTSAVGPHTLAPHVDVRQVEHWFGEVEQKLK